MSFERAGEAKYDICAHCGKRLQWWSTTPWSFGPWEWRHVPSGAAQCDLYASALSDVAATGDGTPIGPESTVRRD